MEKDSAKSSPNQPPKNRPHNLTVVAMEGCHSFIILDWALPVKDDMVSGTESPPAEPLVSLCLCHECAPVAGSFGPTTGSGHIFKVCKTHFRKLDHIFDHSASVGDSKASLDWLHTFPKQETRDRCVNVLKVHCQELNR